ncbi:MAG: hypothetical protein ABEJ23_09075 [Haloarculaceae archaeon]
MSDDPVSDARDRQHERADHVEHILAADEADLADHPYPTSSEDLATRYADQPLDLPNETETLGDVFDRLPDERYETPAEAREALYNALSGEEAGSEEYNDERAIGRLAEDEGREPRG